MEPSHNQFQSADMLSRVDIHGNSPAVILYPDHIIPFKDHQDRIAVPLHSLIDRVIHDLKYQMVETINTGSADVHARSFPYRFKTLKNLYILR
jgi:hypothetical protein